MIGGQLVAHFSRAEFEFSETAIRNGIDNTVPDDLFPNLLVLAQGAERVREVLGVPMRVTSGYRCEALERIIAHKDFLGWCARHGRRSSDATAWAEYFARKAHPKALALDFLAPKCGTPAEFVEVVAAESDYIGFQQCIHEGTWVHVAFPATGKGKGEVLSAKFDSNGVASYTKGIKA